MRTEDPDRTPTAPIGASPGAQDPIALARGLLAAALERCEAGSDSGLQVCAAWEELEEPGHLPEIIDAAVPTIVGLAAILNQARRVLQEAIPVVQPARRALVLGLSIRRIGDALRALELEASCDDPAWP